MSLGYSSCEASEKRGGVPDLEDVGFRQALRQVAFVYFRSGARKLPLSRCRKEESKTR